MDGKTPSGFPIYIPSEKHPAEDESIPFNTRVDAILGDKALSVEQREAGFLGLSDNYWVERIRPPLFVAALSLDPPQVKTQVVEEALRAGADPNELDHDFGKMRNHGRVLAFYVDYGLHNRVNGGLHGMVNNLPAIKILLRYGADPRLPGPFIGPQSALSHVEYAISKGMELSFYKPVYAIMKEAVAKLEENEPEKKSLIGRLIDRYIPRKHAI